MLYLIVTIVAIVANAGTALATLTRAKFVTANVGEVDVPDSRLPLLGSLQAAGAVGLLLGLVGVPVIGVAAAAGLVVFFVGAVVAHLKAGAFASLPSPVLFLVLAVAALVLAVLR